LNMVVLIVRGDDRDTPSLESLCRPGALPGCRGQSPLGRPQLEAGGYPRSLRL
jgi:hypothetical protein